MKILYAQQEKEIHLTSEEKKLSLLQLLWSYSFYDKHTFCSGLGKCGKCKIAFVSSPPKPTSDEENILTPEEIKENIRLSCKHSAKDEDIIRLMDDVLYEHALPAEETLIFTENKSEDKVSACLALDLGTTTAEYAVIANNIVYAKGKQLNPMQGVGSEVMALLKFASSPEKALVLQKKVWEKIELLIKLAQKENIYIEKIILSANSVLTYILLGCDTTSLAHAPYFLVYKGGAVEKIKNFPHLPPIYIPPLLAPFIGSDISSGLYALYQDYEEKKEEFNYPYFFVDMGTNAEFVLALSKEKKLMASVPLGPSVEGIGLTFGAVAHKKSIVDFSLTIQGLQAHMLDKGNEIPTNICGVGYIHLLHTLRKIGILDKEGHFIIDSHPPLLQKVAQFFQHKTEKCLKLTHELYLTPTDIERVLMVKAAFRTAFTLLLLEAGLEEKEIENIYLAGSFGKHVRKEALRDLGFLPHITLEKIQQIGNSSLEGASLLCSSSHQQKIQNTFKDYTYIELADHSLFAKFYMQHFTLE